MTNRRLIKVCGMREAENIREVDALGIDLMGFILWPRSPRFVEAVPAALPDHAARTGVFVDADYDEIVTQADRFGLHYVQLHGNEDETLCRALSKAGLEVIKAFQLADENDLKSLPLHLYAPHCRFFLFDCKSSHYGGSGKQYDWQILHAYNGPTPFFLSGGLNEQSAEALRAFDHPFLAGYDLNSCFESAPAVKNAAQIKRFLDILHH
jgi:phosphoribosylanthranilate isomerase